MEQWRGKYLAKNRVTGQFYETPQMALILIAATGFMAYPRETRMTYVKDFYDAVSTFMISLPTPVMAGLRTPEKQFSSCVTISCGDSLPSIIATSGSVMEYISQKAGIGLDLGRIRAVDSEVAGGRKKHTGQLPIIRLMQSATKSMSQGGVRGGSTTVHYPLWHYEFEDLIMLKNNAGTEFNRIRHMDYSFLFNRTMYQRLVDNADISFFSPHDCLLHQPG
jgi:ribonucleoside-diphosphate reductase alpha chain